MAMALVNAHSPAPLNLKKEGPRTGKEDRCSTWEQGFRLQGKSSGLGQEPLCEQFRQLRYEETTGPREALSRLRELCRRWLRPEMHSKEQIVELLVLEQFLTILPEGLQARVRERRPESGDEVVVMLEHMQLELGEAGQRAGPDQAKKQKVLAEEAAPVAAVREPQVRAERDVPGPEEEKGEGTKTENGKMVVQTDSPGGAESSGKVSEPVEPGPEDPNLEEQQSHRGKDYTQREREQQIAG